VAAQPKRADVGAAANLSRLTGRQAGKPRASELQAETREARFAIDRLRLRLQLSCPHLHCSRARFAPSTPQRLPEHLATKTRSLSMFSAA